MKKIIALFAFIITAVAVKAQHNIHVPDASKPVQIVEASCGLCNFGMKADGCSLAVRIDGKAYFVDGTSIDEHGDAHAKDGFCSATRKAEVQGTIKNGRFEATYFKLLKNKPAGKKKKH